MEFHGLFEHLATDDSHDRVNGRKAAAVAQKRVADRFGLFMQRSASAEERASRLELIQDELNEVVAAVADEYGVDAQRLAKVVEEALAVREASTVHEARRPKMCPYHREVMDISLASGDPTAGFSAMSQHAWGEKHCQGAFDGTCNFKREMVTQDYWDKKAEEAEQRREQREQTQQIEIPTSDFEVVSEPVEEADASFGDETVGGPEIDALDSVPAEAMSMAAAVKEAEALKTEDVTQGGETPSPKMDKRKWTPENVTPLDTEGNGSPNPTRQQDVTDKPDYKGDVYHTSEDGRLDQTKAVLETETLPTETGDAGFSDGGERGKGGTFTENNGADPVTSKVDPDKNPVREILESDFGGFVSEAAVKQAIEDFGGQPQGVDYQALAQQVQDFAKQHYSEGWDVVVEAYTLPEIAEELQQYGATDFKSAIEVIAQGLDIRAAYGNDIRGAGDNPFRQPEQAARPQEF